MTFVCVSFTKDQTTGLFKPSQAAWYFSTATSLDLQNWTAPQLIENSQFPVASPCGGVGGTAFDGWYPSFMSPGSRAGHTSQEGFVFFLNGCNVSLARSFTRRRFHIRLEAQEDDNQDRDRP
ncbi:MAG: hypothetical protein L3J78_03030 [Thermoplasmata archaeon]|nr:hypothetical protein [Thermoplasmata archaeon]